MAKWGGDADATAETPGGQGGNFKPAPRGFYTIQVADMKDGTTRESQRNKVDLECEIADEGDQFGKKVWVTITQIPKGEKGHGLMLHSLHAFGLGLDGAYDFDTADLQGRRARVLLGITQREKVVNPGTPQEKKFINDVNWVEELYIEKHPEPADGVLPAPKEPRGHKTTAQPAGAAARPANAGPRPAKQQEVPF